MHAITYSAPPPHQAKHGSSFRFGMVINIFRVLEWHLTHVLHWAGTPVEGVTIRVKELVGVVVIQHLG